MERLGNFGNTSARVVLMGLLAGCAFAAGAFGQEDSRRAGAGTPSVDGAPNQRRPEFARVKQPELRQTLFDAWKARRVASAERSRPIVPDPALGIVGRASMVINASGSVLYTKHFLNGTCDVRDVEALNRWQSSHPYAAGAVVAPSSGYPAPNGFFGFNFQAMNGGTSGGAEPTWPRTGIGATVQDGNPLSGIITWKAIAFDPAEFVGCTPMQLVIRASGGGETVIAKEGDTLPDGSQLAGWAEFVAMNDSGKAAFRAALAGFPFNDRADEGESGMFTAGPGAGALTRIAQSGDTIGGRPICGFSAMVGINNAGQVIFDTYSGFSVTNPGDCDENDHGLVRFSPGPGNELLVGQGSSVGGSTVVGFGSDIDNAGTCSGACDYNNIEGLINASGHVPVVLKLADGTQGAYNFTGPGASTEIVRTGGAGPLLSLGPRASINDSDQVAYQGSDDSTTYLLLFTPPSTTTTVARVGESIGTDTITALGTFFDLSNSGNMVFQATLSSNPRAYYFWDHTTGLLTEIAREGQVVGSDVVAAQLGSEMISLNKNDVAAFVAGSGSPDDEPNGASEMHESGALFAWSPSGGLTRVMGPPDVISGNAVGALYAQHPTFRRRQLSSTNCVATLYFVGADDDLDLDNTEGTGFTFGGQLFSSCSIICSQPAAPVLSAVPATVGIGSTVTLTWTGVMGAGKGTYTIQRFFDDSSEIIASGIAATGAATQQFLYTDLGPLGDQTFQVQAIPNCDPALASFSNVPSITVTNCITPQPPPSLGINSSILPQGAVATLTWDAPFGFGGTYTVLYSVDNGVTFNTFASGITITGFAFTVQFPVGTTVIFEVVADAGCGPVGVSAPSPAVSLQVVQTCPAAKGPVDQEDRQQVAVGDTWSLHWTSTLPQGQGGPAGLYDVQISEDLGVSFHSVGTTTNTSFTGPPVPQSDLGKIVFLQVIARPSCNTGNLSAGFGNVVFFVVVPGCEAPEAARNASIEAASVNGQPIDRPPFPTEPLSLSWDAPLSGTPPTGYLIAINGDVPVLVTGGTGGIAPARGNADPVTLFVTSVACDPQKPGPTIQSPTVALLSQPPGASFSVSPNPKAGQPVTFTDTSSPQATSWLWLFDDGSQSADQSPTKTFAAAGTHTAALIATNGAGSGSAVQSFSVNAASSTVTAAAGSETVGFTAAQPGRRRVSVDVERPGALWLQLTSQAKQDTTLFLRFLDGSGNLVMERRMVVAQGASVTHDLAAFGLRGVYSIELVGDPSVGAKVVRTGRSTREVRR
jgi:PKD domain